MHASNSSKLRSDTILRLDAFLEEIQRLKQIEFPYVGPFEALCRLEEVILEESSYLRDADYAEEDAIQSRCAIQLTKLFKFTPLLGFILRATNTRNAFEITGPLLRLSRQLLASESSKKGNPKSKIRLILSSEWDYSPLTYSRNFLTPELRDFLLIGFPAPESSNPLLLSLAGHELGHNVWHHHEIKNRLREPINRKIVDLITNVYWSDYQLVYQDVTIEPDLFEQDLAVQDTWKVASDLAINQAEETFCDILGLRIFGLSYLKAFTYLLSPKIAGRRDVYYPKMSMRMQNLESAAKKFGLSLDNNYSALMQDRVGPTLTNSDRFQLKVADAALNDCVAEIIEHVDRICQAANIPNPKDIADEENRVIERFRHAVPAERVENFVSIVNAGWTAFETKDFWTDFSHLHPFKNSILRDLVLKNMELYEIEHILADAKNTQEME